MLCIGKTGKILITSTSVMNRECKCIIFTNTHSRLTFTIDEENPLTMNTELIGVIVTFLLTILLSIPLGKYIAKVFSGEKTFLDFMAPLERLIYRICGIDPKKGMNWKEFLKAMLTINVLWFVYGFLMLI